VTELSDAALDYIRVGLHVLPLHHKRPNNLFYREWSYEDSLHGTIDTPEEERAVRAIFEHETTTGVAVLIPPDVLTADVDTEDAATLYMSLAGALPETPVAQTKNGLHIWLLSPGADRNYWLGGRTLLLKGLGGYVAAPPSRHFDEEGNQDGVYTWLRPLVVGDTIGPIDFMPEKMSAYLHALEDRDSERQAWANDAAAEREWIEYAPREDGGWSLIRRIGIEGIVKAVRDAGEGNRNNMLAWAAMTCQEEGVPYDQAAPMLMEAALAAGLRKDESKTTIRSAYRRRKGQPQ
jgi:hypothetical protein